MTMSSFWPLIFLLPLSVSGVEVIESTYFAVGYLESESYITSRINSKEAINQVYCASRCLATRQHLSLKQTCNAYQYNKDTYQCDLLVIKSPIKDVDSGNGIRIMFDNQTVRVMRPKLKLNCRAFFTLDGPTGLMDLSGYGNNIRLSLESFTDSINGRPALRMQDQFAIIEPAGNSLTINNENLMVCMWYKDYNNDKPLYLMSWRWDYRFTNFGSCERWKYQCDKLDLCLAACKVDCSHRFSPLGIGTCTSAIKRDCQYKYYWRERCSIDVHSAGIRWVYDNNNKFTLKSYLGNTQYLDHISESKSRPQGRWYFLCMTQNTKGVVKFYKNGNLVETSSAKHFKDGTTRSLNSERSYPGLGDTTVMTDEIIFIGRNLRDDNYPTHERPYITDFDASISNVQIYIGEEMFEEDVKEAMALLTQ